VTLLVTGSSKAEIVMRFLLERESGKRTVPASFVNPINGLLELYLDRSAAAHL
jgi:6-phosphogluconolactonase/glucosamine-6-phosphate isomerase/deaminase